MESPEAPAWTLTSLQQLISDKIEEGLKLDYKSAKFLGRGENQKDAITTAVSAFANSAGGTVIFGVSEFSEREKRHLPEKIDPIDGLEFSREWLDQILGQISPRIEGLKIEPVRVGPEEKHVCYVVEIPQSHTAHQARDCKYYRRANFESVPMVDYEIRDIMSRRKHPKLEFTVRLEHTNRTRILARIWNKGAVLARHYEVKVLIPVIIGRANLYPENPLQQTKDGFQFWRVSLRGRIDQPLFPGSDSIPDFEIKHTPRQWDPPIPSTADYLICNLFADEMPCIERKIPVNEALAGWT